MKKYCLAAMLSLAVTAPVAQADTVLGLYAGADAWFSNNDGSLANNGSLQQFDFDNETNLNYWIALEHPVPLIPNVKIRYTDLTLNGQQTLTQDFTFDGDTYSQGTRVNSISDLSHTDYVLYYEIFDNDLVSIDLGLNAKHFSGDVRVNDEANTVSGKVDFSGYVPLVYGAVEIGLPFTGFSVFAEGSMLAIDDSKIHDYQLGVMYAVVDNVAVDVDVKLGYRSMVIELDDIDNISTDLDMSGPFAGVQIHF